MADNLTDILRDRIDRHEKKTDGHFSNIDNRLREIDKTLNHIHTAIQPHPRPWWINAIIAPLIVAAILATAGDIIYLHICIKGLQGYVHDTGGFIAGLQLQKSANSPTDPKSAANAKQVLEEAKAKKIKIDPGIVEATGKKFVEFGINNQTAWSTALTFVSYRSFLNSRPNFGDGQITPPRPGTPLTEQYITTLNILNPSVAKIGAAGLGTPTNRAAFRPIGTPDANASHPHPNAFLIVTDADLLLDNLYLKNVVIENSHVIYRGGAVFLSNVTFVNCTFEVLREPIGQEFADKALDAVSSFSLNVKFDLG
jgi:hypothetical protein